MARSLTLLALGAAAVLTGNGARPVVVAKHSTTQS